MVAERYNGIGMTRDEFVKALEAARPKLHRYLASRRVVNRDEREDLVQDTVIRALRRWETFKGETFEDLMNWLYRIAANIHLDSIRAAKRRVEKADDYFGERVLPDEGHIKVLIDQMMRQVPGRAARTFQMLSEGETYTAIAKEFDVPVGTIRSRLFRMRQDPKVKELGDFATEMVCERDRNSREVSVSVVQ